MSTFQFATCDRRRALRFLRVAYPGRAVEDTPESAGPLLDLIEKDVVRVTDPSFHTPQIVPGKQWAEDAQKREEITAVCAEFHRRAVG